jgi:catechol 2,3-dioxygenase-like lactoylglutathione lyase family enzyme
MTPIKIRGLDHVVLRVSDVKRSVRWYRSVLGCQVERVLPSFGLYQMRAGGTLIDLLDINGKVGRAGGAAAGKKRRNMDHFCLQLEHFNAERMIVFLKRHKVALGTVERRYGALGHGPSLYLTDPDGNIVELKGPPAQDQSEQVAGARYPGLRSARVRPVRRA